MKFKNALTLALLFGACSAQAANLTWDANAATAGQTDGAGAWLDTNQWWAGAANATWNNATPDNAAIGVGGAGGTITLGTVTAGSLTFNGFTGAYTLSGGGLTLNSGLTMNNGAGAVTFGSPITLGGAQSWLNNSESVLTISGGVINGANLLTLGGNGSIIVSSDIGSGAGGLAKTGAGMLTLNGSAVNTFTGGLTLNGGTLLADFVNLGAPTDLIDSGNTLALGGGILSVKGKSSGTTSQTLGNVTVNAGGGQILGNKNGGTSTTINLGTLTATASGGSLLAGNATTTAANAPVITTTMDKDATGIYGGRIVLFNGTANTGYDWATTATASPGPYTLSAYSGYTVLPTSGGNSSVNYKMTASTTLAGNFSVNTLKIENPAASQTLALGANTLTIEGGGLLKTGANSGTTISGTAGGTRLTAGNGSGSYDLVVHTGGTGNGLLTISAVIGNNGANAVTLVKSGPGTLILSGANTYSGNTYANAGILDFAAASLTGFGGGSGRNINVAAGAGVRRNTLDNTFLQRVVETTNEITVMTGATGNSFDFSSSSTGANLPNAFLGNWAGNGAKAEYSGTLTPANNTYRLGSPISSGLLGITGTLTDNGATPRSLIVGGNRVELVGTGNTFSGDTVIRTGGRLYLGNNLALQNSAFDLGTGADSIAGTFACSTDFASGRITGSTRTDSPTFGGLKGNRNLLSVYNSASAGNNAGLLAATAVTGFTLNPGAGRSYTYSGVIANFAAGTILTKTGAGTQILAGANTYTGATRIDQGTLALGVGGSIDSSSEINVAAGATFDVSALASYTLGSGRTLKGNGTMTGSLIMGAGSILSPGNSTGTNTFNNALTLDGNTNVFELVSTGDHDMTVITAASGSLTIQNKPILDVRAVGLVANMNDVLILFDNQFLGTPTLTDTFWLASGEQLSNNSTFTADGTMFQIDYYGGTGGNDIVLSVIPEPTALYLMGMIGAAVLLRRRMVLARK